MKTPRRGCVFWRERESVFAPSFQIVSSVRVPQTHRSALCPLEKEGETNGIKSDKGQTSVSVSSRFYSTDWEQSEGEARERERGSEWEGKAQAGKQRDTRREEGEEGEVGEVGDMDTAAETPLYCDTHRALDLRSCHRECVVQALSLGAFSLSPDSLIRQKASVCRFPPPCRRLPAVIDGLRTKQFILRLNVWTDVWLKRLPKMMAEPSTPSPKTNPDGNPCHTCSSVKPPHTSAPPHGGNEGENDDLPSRPAFFSPPPLSPFFLGKGLSAKKQALQPG
ncbi:hypothetical protein C0J45_21757 [Silurus meridionalis]|nr:hypothetical protein C0J45_21757 [Silurus meridionalis]